MPQLEVYCTVKNCDYWGKDNHCLAEKILIVTDEQASTWPDSVDAPMASNLQSAEVQTCMATACKTFRTRYDQAGPVQDQRNQNQVLAQKYPHQ
jgi:hypothetical protein